MRFWKIQAGIFATLFIALFPVLHLFGLPARIEIGQMATLYFISTGIQVAVPLFLFYLIQRREILHSLLAKRGLIWMVLGLAVFLWWLTGGRLRLFLAVVCASVLFVCAYPMITKQAVMRSALPVLSLFAGLLIAFSYGSIGSAVLEFSKFDSSLLATDRFLLFGHSVGDFSRWILAFPHLGNILEAIYYGLFGLMGAALLWLSCEGDKGQAADLVSDILTCYIFTLAIYWLMPSLGPFIFSPSAVDLSTIAGQKASVPYLSALRQHREMFAVSASYFVAFPSMHLAEAALVTWHMRKWPFILAALIGFDALLVVAIVGLQWHYVVDLVGGMAVVFAAVMLRQRVNSMPCARSATTAP